MSVIGNSLKLLSIIYQELLLIEIPEQGFLQCTFIWSISNDINFDLPEASSYC